MIIVDRFQALASKVVSRGRERVDHSRADRRRSKLLRELGASCYAQSKGVATSDAEIERIIGEIDDLDVPAGDEPATPDADAAVG